MLDCRLTIGDSKLLSQTPRLALIISTCLALLAPSATLGASSTGDRSGMTTARSSKLKDIERNRKEVQERLHDVQRKADEARRRERQAIQKLHTIENALNSTKGALNHSQKDLKTTERKIGETDHNLARTKSLEEIATEQACNRLRDIYEGQRLGLVEMIFQVSSVQTLLDVFYYQERIAEMDRKLLEGLRAKAVALSVKKNQLGSKKNVLGDLVSEFAKKALQLNKAKDDQEEVAEKLRTQRAFYEDAERQLASESHSLERQILDMCQNQHDSKTVVRGSGTMSMPLNASISSPFGYRRHPIFGVRKFHTGIDLAGRNHSPVHAADSGNVIFSGWYGGYGKVVIVSHGKDLATLYAHMSKIGVSVGQNLQKGEVVGYEGSTGFSTGPHLHFEVRLKGKPNNPLNFVQ